MDKVSVIVPVYNSDKYIQKCLLSICGQSYKKIEVSLIDDGSEDLSAEYIDEIALQDHRIINVHFPNKGVSVARNIGLQVVSGKYVTFVDSDDWIESNYYETAINQIGQNDLFVCGVYVNYYEDKSVENNIYHRSYELTANEAQKMMLSNAFFKGFPVNKVYRSSIIGSYRIQFDGDIKYCEDLLFNTRYFLRCKRVKYLSEPYYHYRIHSGSAVEGGNYSSVVTGCESFKRINELLKKTGCEDQELLDRAYLGVSRIAMKTMDNMGIAGRYDKKIASYLQTVFLAQYPKNIEQATYETRIRAKLFKWNPHYLYYYCRIKYFIRNILTEKKIIK